MDGQMAGVRREYKIHVLFHTSALRLWCALKAFVLHAGLSTAAPDFPGWRSERSFNSAKILRMKIPFTPQGNG
jgi:hypothetical protein